MHYKFIVHAEKQSAEIYEDVLTWCKDVAMANGDNKQWIKFTRFHAHLICTFGVAKSKQQQTTLT